MLGNNLEGSSVAISYHEALHRIQTHVQPLCDSETLPLLSSLNRISSHDVCAQFSLPRYPMSLKEGYGVSFLEHAADYTLLKPPYPSIIPQGYGVHLSTGGQVPLGVDTIIAHEDAHEDHGKLFIPSVVSHEQHIKKEGEDITRGEVLVHAFERITAQKMTALASQGIEYASVLKKPRIGIVSVGSQLASGEIHNSNAITIAARVIEMGGCVEHLKICDEHKTDILNTLEVMSHEVDGIITTGGMSPDDAMCHLVMEKHLSIVFHYVRLAPAKPSALSMFHNKPILHLPGLPLGCLLGFEMLGIPLLKQLLHHANIFPDSTIRINQKRIVCKPNCMNAIPGYSDGRGFSRAPYYEAGRLNILSSCNGYTLIEDRESVEEGEEIPFFSFTHPPVS